MQSWKDMVRFCSSKTLLASVVVVIRFGHVSPTTAEHVFDDLGGHDIIILKADGGAAGQEEQCEVGIESTVAKVDVANKQVRGPIRAAGTNYMY